MVPWHLKMGPTGCPETYERNYHYSLRNNPEERSSLLLLVYCSAQAVNESFLFITELSNSKQDGETTRRPLCVVSLDFKQVFGRISHTLPPDRLAYLRF